MQHNIGVLVNLRVLGQLQPHDRVRGDSTYLEIESRWGLSAILRWWRADNREKALQRIQHVMEEAAKLDGTDELVKSAVHGLTQLLHTTYKDDPLTVARLEVIISSVSQESSPKKPSYAAAVMSASLPSLSSPPHLRERPF